jgi:HK97 family phage major capsid protein
MERLERLGMPVSNASPGQDLAQLCKAFAMAGEHPLKALGYAQTERMSANVVDVLKANVAAIGSTDGLAPARAAFAVFAPLLRPRTLLDRISGWRRIEPGILTFAMTGDATGAIVAEGAPTPASAFSFATVQASLRKVAAIVVVTNDVFKQSSPAAQGALADQVARAVGLGTDRAMFQVDATGSIANSGTIITSAGSSLANIDSDLQRMIAYFADGDAALDSAVFTMSATTAAYLASLRGTAGAPAYPKIGARGGELLGIPVFVSGALSQTGVSPTNGQITLLDPTQILVADPGLAEVKASQQAALQMLTNPTNDSRTPTATQMVSLMQTNSTAIHATRWLDWQVTNTEAVVTLEGVAY